MTEKVKSKKCPMCNQLFPLTSEYFYRTTYSKSGFVPQCKKCLSERGKKYKIKNKEKMKLYHRKYREQNKDKRAKYNKEYVKLHREERLKYYKEYRTTNRDQTLKRSKNWRENNKAHAAEYQKAYRKTKKGRDVFINSNHKRRIVMQQYEKFSPTAVFERDGYICQYCNRKTRPDYNQYHPLYPNLDHIVPISMGGEHTKLNTQCLCRHCNIVKNNVGVGDQLRLFG